ncbi:MAG: hypothetical protein BAJATHORv1_30365 [Candidatus Thorarchaeota archaeon]|nr:MAG: hypothetical protein BAJATHORv1_30365 [Candidatus Thorarchaeota archaeon]
MKYGEGYLPIENGTISLMDKYQPRSVIGFQDIPKSILHAIENPVESLPLSSLISEANSICIAVENIQNRLIQQVTRTLVRILNNSSTGSKTITFLFSTNESNLSNIDSILHYPSQFDMNIEIHSSLHSNNIRHIGDTPTHSTPLYLNNSFLSAELRIGVGTIIPDLFIGATGGRTAVLPGVAGFKSVSANLKLQTTSPFRGYDLMSNSSQDMIEAAEIAELDFVLNLVEDYQGNLATLSVGDPKTAWNQGAHACHSIASITPKQRYDIAVVCAGGSPYDRTLFDSINSLYNGFQFTRHNGVILLVAECPEGPGPEGFVNSITAANSEIDVQLQAQNGFELGMERARVYWKILSDRKIIVCSRLNPAIVEGKLQASSVRDPQEGFELARKITGTRSRIAVLQNSQSIIPKVS